MSLETEMKKVRLPTEIGVRSGIPVIGRQIEIYKDEKLVIRTEKLGGGIWGQSYYAEKPDGTRREL